MNLTPEWKQKFYAGYVSSGQAMGTGNAPARRFAPRAAFLCHLIAAHVPADLGLRILDLACGAGALLYFLKQAGYDNIAGVDVSAEQINLAGQLGIPEATCSSVEDFLATVATASADVVFLLDILEHLTPEQGLELMAQVRRVLRPGGRCIGHVPNGQGLFGMGVRFGDMTHELAFTATSVRQLTSVAGFARTHSFEDKPQIHGLKSLVRRLLWDGGTLPYRLLYMAESGIGGVILSQNLTFVAEV